MNWTNFRLFIKEQKWGIIFSLASVYLSITLVGPVTSLNKFITNIPVLNLLIKPIPLYVLPLSLIIFWIVYRTFNYIKVQRRQLKILTADYGSGNTFVDITNQLNNLVVDNKLNVTMSNGILGFDPTPNVLKIGHITYESDGKILTKKYVEGEVVDLP